ncbi:MAG: hypothetical protein NVSMB65_00940 [Chloroflexota bacterium]
MVAAGGPAGIGRTCPRGSRAWRTAAIKDADRQTHHTVALVVTRFAAPVVSSPGHEVASRRGLMAVATFQAEARSHLTTPDVAPAPAHSVEA